MKKLLLPVIAILAVSNVAAQTTEKKLSYKLYGYVRGDAAFDNRRNVAANEGLILLYPLDRNLDARGADLNAVSAAGFYSFNTRLGINLSGGEVFNAGLTGKIEADFAGFSGSYGSNSSVLRIRQAYVQMNWAHSSLLVGQTWHPMHGPVVPEVISLSAGAPFNPFNRSPMVRFSYTAGDFRLLGAAIWQLQFLSQGPDGKSTAYQRHALLPELYAGVDYTAGGFIAGAGVDYLTLKPRIAAPLYLHQYMPYYPYEPLYWYQGNGKVNESISSLSVTGYVKYAAGLFTLSAKSIYGQNLSHLTMLGGYGVSGYNHYSDSPSYQRDYKNYAHSASWLGLTYGKKLQGGVFLGYSKNLTTRDDLATVIDYYPYSAVPSSYAPAVGQNRYGEGLGLDDLRRLSATFSYNIPNFMLGIEYELTSARYGGDSWKDVNNHRLTAVISYLF